MLYRCKIYYILSISLLSDFFCVTSEFHQEMTKSSAELKRDKLPTCADALQKNLLEKSKSVAKSPNLKEIFKWVAIEIEEIWNQTCIPIISQKQIKVRIEKLYKSYTDVIKESTKPCFESKIDELKKKTTTELFDICKCKCLDLYECNCDRSSVVPKNEKDFLLDQRTKRRMIFGEIDK